LISTSVTTNSKTQDEALGRDRDVDAQHSDLVTLHQLVEAQRALRDIELVLAVGGQAGDLDDGCSIWADFPPSLAVSPVVRQLHQLGS